MVRRVEETVQGSYAWAKGLMEKRFLGIEELSQYLGLTKGTLYVWVCQRRLPYLKIGKLLKFDIIEINQWLKDKRVKELT